MNRTTKTVVGRRKYWGIRHSILQSRDFNGIPDLVQRLISALIFWILFEGIFSRVSRQLPERLSSSGSLPLEGATFPAGLRPRGWRTNQVFGTFGTALRALLPSMADRGRGLTYGALNSKMCTRLQFNLATVFVSYFLFNEWVVEVSKTTLSLLMLDVQLVFVRLSSVRFYRQSNW